MFILDWVKNNKMNIIMGLVLVLAAYKIYENFKTNEVVNMQKQELQRLKGELVNTERNYISEKELRAKIEKQFIDLKKEQTAQSITNTTITEQGVCAYIPAEGGEVTLFDKGPKIGSFSKDKDGFQWRSYSFDINLATAVVSNPDGTFDVLQKGNLVTQDGSDKGKEFALHIKDAVTFINPASKSKYFMWRFSPSLTANLDMTTTPHFGLSLFTVAYGASYYDLSFKMLGFGMDYSTKDLAFTVTPVSYRVFEKWMPNTYLGIGFRFGKTTAPFIGINIGF